MSHLIVTVVLKCGDTASIRRIPQSLFNHTKEVRFLEIKDEEIRGDECSGYFGYLATRYETLSDYTLFVHPDADEHIMLNIDGPWEPGPHMPPAVALLDPAIKVNPSYLEYADQWIAAVGKENDAAGGTGSGKGSGKGSGPDLRTIGYHSMDVDQSNGGNVADGGMGALVPQAQNENNFYRQKILAIQSIETRSRKLDAILARHGVDLHSAGEVPSKYLKRRKITGQDNILEAAAHAALMGNIEDLGFQHLSHNRDTSGFEYHASGILFKKLFQTTLRPSVSPRSYCCSHFIVSKKRVHRRPQSFYANAKLIFTTREGYVLPPFPAPLSWDLKARTLCQNMMKLWHLVFGHPQLRTPLRHRDHTVPYFLKGKNFKIQYENE